jgi:carbon storage regulator
MLLLARKPGEAIQIGDQITVHVVEIRGKQVRLGIEAPAEMPVHRIEIHARLSPRNLQRVDLARHHNKAMTAEEES